MSYVVRLSYERNEPASSRRSESVPPLRRCGEVMSETCAKCGKEPRAGKNRWGKTCLSEQRRRLRAGVEPVEPTVPTKGDREADVEAEVARLKRELASRVPAPPRVAQAPMTRLDAVSEMPARGYQGRGKTDARAEKGSVKRAVDGPMSQALWARSQRG